MNVWGDSSGFSRKIVATRTKKAAREAMGVSAYHFDLFVAETGNRFEVMLGNRNPGQVYVLPHSGRCKFKWLRLPEGADSYTYTGGSR